MEICRLDGSADRFSDFMNALSIRLDVLNSDRKNRKLQDLQNSYQTDIAAFHNGLMFTMQPIGPGTTDSISSVQRTLEFPADSLGTSTDSLVHISDDLKGFSEGIRTHYVIEMSRIGREHNRERRRLLDALEAELEQEIESARSMANCTYSGWKREEEQCRLYSTLQRVSTCIF